MNMVKEILSKKLIERNSFWSFKMPTEIPDDILIEKPVIFLDIEDINQLFKLFPPKKIKQIWRDRLVIQERAVRGTAIAQQNPVRRQDQLGVVGGHRGMSDDKVAVRGTPHPVHSEPKLKGRPDHTFRSNNQLSHFMTP